MNFPRMSLSQFFKKQSASEIEIETEGSSADLTTPEETTGSGAEESATEETETVETVTEPVAEAADPTNGDIVINDPPAESADSSASAETENGNNFQAIVQAVTAELNLFGTTPEARTNFRTEATRNKSFIEALKNVGVISDEDTTTTVQEETGLRSYEAAPWNKAAIAKRK
jgi:hypothetical protein